MDMLCTVATDTVESIPVRLAIVLELTSNYGAKLVYLLSVYNACAHASRDELFAPVKPAGISFGNVTAAR